MNVNRILSLAVFVSVVAVMRWLAPAEVWNNRPGLVVAAMIAGAVAALVHWCLCCWIVDQSLSRLHAQVSLLADEARALRPGWLGWPGGLTQAIDRTAAALRRRIDVLERRSAEAEARARTAEAARQRLETIVRCIGEGVIVTDARDRVVLANDAAARALGLGANDARERPIEGVIKDAELVRLIRQTRETGDTLDTRRVEHPIGSNGSTRIFEVALICAAEPIDAVAGDPARGAYEVVTVLHEVTSCQQLAAVRSDLICGVSHELRTPLSTIRAYAEMLLDGEATDEPTRRDFYTIIQGESQRLARLIENVLNISRIESGMLQVQRERVALAGLAHDAVELMCAHAAAKQISLNYDPGSLDGAVYGDRDMLLQALLNLVSNAIKYTSKGGSVNIDLKTDEVAGTVSIHVTDTGMGVPPGELPRVFEKFYRVREHRKMAPGTGLGLNLVKQIVETVHHGVVAVRSEIGYGSTFSITLPGVKGLESGVNPARSLAQSPGS